MKKNNPKLKIGIFGMGKWGKNLIREFSTMAEIVTCVTTGNNENIIWIKKNYHTIQFSTDINDILDDDKIIAVVIATPISTHYELAKKSLEAGKHVFIEKPFTKTVRQANELIKIAKNKKLCLFVGHVFLHSEIFQQIKKINKRGSIKHMNFDWKKFGTFKEDIFENLLSHDLSINLELFDIPKQIKLINKSSWITNSDIVSIMLGYGKNKKSEIHINRISNFKKKTITIFTKKNLYVWDDDKLFKLNKKTHSFNLYYRSKNTPLCLECKTFVSDVTNKKPQIDSAILAKKITSLISEIKK